MPSMFGKSLAIMALTVLLAITAACAFRSPPADSPNQAPAAAHLTVIDKTAYGTLTLTINWPKREGAAFQAAAIPASANSVGVFVKDGATLLHKVAVPRPADGSPTKVVLDLKAANNLTVEIKAYREANPDLEAGIVIAQGAASGINILASRTTSKAITLAPLGAPTITAISPNPAKPGDTVTITGANLGPINGITPSVTFAGGQAITVTPSGGKLLAVVPAWAVVGNVTVTNDGLTSVSDALFHVASKIGISADRLAFDKGPADSRMVRYGTTLLFGATTTYLLPEGKALGDFGPAPAVSWTSSNPQLGLANTIDGAGIFTAATSNLASAITARVGNLVSSSILAIPVGVDRVILDRTAASVNAAPANGAMAAGWIASNSITLYATVQTSLPFNGGVQWILSDPSRVSSNPSTESAAIKAVNGANEGTAVITAKAVDDDRILATASMAVTNIGRMRLVVE